MTAPSSARSQYPTDNFLDHSIPNFYQPQKGVLVRNSAGVDYVAQEISKLIHQSPTLQNLHQRLTPLSIKPPSFLASADVDYQRNAVQSWRSGAYPSLPQNDEPQVRISHRALLQDGVVYPDAQGRSPAYIKDHRFSNPEGTAHHIALQMHGLDAHHERAKNLNGVGFNLQIKAKHSSADGPYDITAHLDKMRKITDHTRGAGYVEAWNAAVDVSIYNQTFTTPEDLAKKIPEGALYLRLNPKEFDGGDVSGRFINLIKGILPPGDLLSRFEEAPKASDFYLDKSVSGELGALTRTKTTDHQSYAETLLALATAVQKMQVFTVNAKPLGLTSEDLKASGLPQAFPYGSILIDSDTRKVLFEGHGLQNPQKTHKTGHAPSDANPLHDLAQTDPALHQLLTAAQLPGKKAMDAALGKLQQTEENRVGSPYLLDAPADPAQRVHAIVR